MILGVGIGLAFGRGAASQTNRLLALLRSEASQLIMHPLEYGFMFQDRAGTAPVTASGQLVGHCLDAGGGGYHATAVSDAARGTFAVVPETGRRNLLTYTEQFDDAAWTKQVSGTGAAPIITADAALSPVGDLTAERAQLNLNGGTAATDLSQLLGPLTALVAAPYTLSVWLKTTSGTSTIRISIAGAAALNAVVTETWQRFSTTWNASAGSWNVRIGLQGGMGASDMADIHVWGAQLERSATATAYQRVGSQYDVTEVGKKSLPYIAYNGVNTAYQTPVLPAPGVDKVQVFAGLRKLSDAATGIPIELSASSATNNSSFHLAAPDVSLTYGWFSRGTTRIQAQTPASFAAPITNTVTGIGDISGDNATIRVNGTQVAQSTADQGSGNYNPSGTYPLYYGARAGTSAFFNGHHYRTLGPIVRFGTNATPEQIAAAEAYYTAGLPS